MRKALVTGMTAAAAVTAGCGQARSDPGPATSRSYQVGAFDRIEVAGPYEVQVTTGSAPSVHATGGERAIERMVVEVNGDTLEIHPQKRKGWNFGWSRKAGAVKLTVTVPSLRAAEIAGSGDISVDRVTGARFEGEVAGSGDLRLAQVAVDQLKMGIAGRDGAGAFRAFYELLAFHLDRNISFIADQALHAELAPAANRVAQRLSKSFKVQGFRPGKAPVQMVKSTVGAATFNAELIEEALPETYAKAVKGEDLRPVGSPEVSVTGFDEKEGLKYEAHVALIPEVKLPDISKLKVAFPEKGISDADVEATMEELREARVREAAVDRPAARTNAKLQAYRHCYSAWSCASLT